MCDTMVSRNAGAPSFFAKNSDRDPGEPQLIQYVDGNEGVLVPSHPEHRKTYDRIQYRRMQQASARLPNPLRAIISRPAWMWGAEMGVNEAGVAIGNEAVFAKSRTAKDGLLGMDILRLALHNARTAADAVEVIGRLLETYGQGGNGSYAGTLRYHNSFLIADASDAWILESAANHWAAKAVETVGTISNAYTIGTQYAKGDEVTMSRRPDFARTHASRLHVMFTKGTYRQQTTEHMLKGHNASWDAMRSTLRHQEGDEASPDRTMKSICMDASGFIKSRTSASMIVEYHEGMPLVWMTGSPIPRHSPFLPFAIDAESFDIAPHADLRFAYRFATERIALDNQIQAAPVAARQQIADLARSIEDRCRAMVLESRQEERPTACVACLAEEQGFREHVHAILVDFGADSSSLHEKPDAYYRCG